MLPGLAAGQESKSGYEGDESFNSPSSTINQLKNDNDAREPLVNFESIDEGLEPWFAFKRDLDERYGLKLGFAATGLYQYSTEAEDESDAFGTIVRQSIVWDFYNREGPDKGTFYFSVDNRTSHTDVAPNALSQETGYLGQSGALFGDFDTVLGDFYFSKYFNKGDSAIIGGRYDPNDFLDVLGSNNAWEMFQHLTIFFNGSLALPDWTTGIGGGHYINDQYYFRVSVSDVNSDATDSSFRFRNDQLLKMAEFGWSPSRAERYDTNVHITFWDADERDNGVAAGDGILIGANYTWDNNLMVFTKVGWSDTEADEDDPVEASLISQIYDEAYTLGFTYSNADNSRMFGLAVNQGKLANKTLVEDEQTAYEMFYRFQLSKNIGITPSIQKLDNPGLPGGEDTLIYAIRARFAI